MLNKLNSLLSKKKGKEVSNLGNANGFSSRPANNLSGRAIRYDQLPSNKNHTLNTTDVPRRITKAPITTDGVFNVCVNSQGFLVWEDVISSGYSVDNVCLARLKYEDIQTYILQRVNGRITKRKEKFARDSADYIVTARGYK